VIALRMYGGDGLSRYRRGDRELLHELSEGWLFYAGIFDLPETETPLTYGQAVTLWNDINQPA